MNESSNKSSPTFDQFVRCIKSYFKGESLFPDVEARNEFSSSSISLMFSDSLLRRFIDNPDDIRKPYEVATKYGFRGYSSGKKNGIFLQKRSDNGLFSATKRLKIKHLDTINQYLESSQNESLKKVKIVWHNPSGERIVGLYSTQKDRMLFLDFANY